MICSQSIPAIVLASITIYTGIYHLLLSYRRRRKRTDLFFALTCLAMGVYDIFCAGLYSSTTLAAGMSWQRVQMVSLALVGITFVWFCSDYTASVSWRYRRLSTIYFTTMAAIMALAPDAWIFHVDRPALRAFRFFGSAVSYHEAEFTALAALLHGLTILTFIYMLIVGMRFYQRENRRRALPLVAAMICFFIGAVNDTAVAVGLSQSIYILEYAYMGMVILMAVHLATEVSEISETRALLRELESRIRAIFRNTAVGLAMTDREGIITRANPGLCQMFGTTSDALVGQSMFDHFHAGDRTSLQRMAERIINGEGSSFRAEKRYIWPDQSLYWGDVSISTVHAPGDEAAVEGMIWIVVGITERRRAVDSLRALNEELEDKVHARTHTLINTNRRLEESLQKLRDDEEAGKLIQTNLLPPAIEQIGPIVFARHLEPSFYMSGDFVDYFRIDDNRIGFYIADVSGHGVSSAFVTVLLKSFISYARERFMAHADPGILDPGLLLTRLNGELLAQELGKHLTLFYGVIDTAQNHLTFANGGQFPYPVILTAKTVEQMKIKGTPLGMFPFSIYANVERELPSSFVLALFSDGVLELLDQPSLMDKQQHLESVVKRSDGDLGRMVKRLALDTTTMPPDDVSILTVQKL